jgi:hypothetical protein
MDRPLHRSPVLRATASSSRLKSKRTVAAEHLYASPKDRFRSNLGQPDYFILFPSISQETGSAVGARRYQEAFGLASGYLDLDAHVLSLVAALQLIDWIPKFQSLHAASTEQE